MKRNNFLFIITIILLSSMSLALTTQVKPVWQRIPSSVDESGVMSLLVFPARHSEPRLPIKKWMGGQGNPQGGVKNPNLILAGTQQAVYRSTDEGKTFRPVLQLPSSEKRINYLYIDAPQRSVRHSEPRLPIKKWMGGQGSPKGEVKNLMDEEILRFAQDDSDGISQQFPTQIFAATNSGLFISQDQGLRWEKIFSSADPLTRHCLSVLIDRDTVYLGTENGLFYQKEGEFSWQKISGFLNADSTEKIVSSLGQDKNFIYVSTSHEVFRIDKEGGDIQKIFSLANREEEIEIIAEETDSFSLTSQIKQINILNEESLELYLATTKGIFQSLDQGKTWTNLNSSGLPVEDITSLLVLPGQDIWVGTLKGVFRYKDGRWLPLYKGMETNRVNFLASDHQGNVYAATDRGIFSLRYSDPALAGEESLPDEIWFDSAHHPSNHPEQVEGLRRYAPSRPANHEGRGGQNDGKMLFHNEPSIQEVHEMAIRYAEVSPRKIEGWRSAARKRGLMPKLSTGINRSATEMFHWDTGPNPDTLAKGRDFLDWDVSLSWDFGDLIWNPDQTSIDSRSKLMVELREDVLDQVTRLYFERRRVQLELAQLTSSQLSESLGQAFESEKEMRVEELTALIDALTGGEFSRGIQKDQKGEKSGCPKP